MYILKNAMRCIARAKGRNILIGIIALVIAISACIGLSIQQAAKDAKAEALEGLTITANISYDRQSVMNNMMGGGRPDPSQGFDKDSFSEIMGNASSLALEEYQKYAGADTVKSFYYTLTAGFNGSENLSPVSTSTEEETTEQESSDRPSGGGMLGGGFGGFGGGMMMGGMNW